MVVWLIYRNNEQSKALHLIRFPSSAWEPEKRILINMKLTIIGHGEHRETQEDFHDVLVSQVRKDEPKVDWEDLKAEMVHEETGAK